jgi:hypothetical protein
MANSPRSGVPQAGGELFIPQLANSPRGRLLRTVGEFARPLSAGLRALTRHLSKARLTVSAHLPIAAIATIAIAIAIAIAAALAAALALALATATATATATALATACGCLRRARRSDPPGDL